MSNRPSRGIISVIKKYQTDHEIIRYNRSAPGEPVYVDGIAQPTPQTRVAIKGVHQPIGSAKLIKPLDEGERLEDVKKWWTLDDTQPRDELVIEGVIYTVLSIMKWTNYQNVHIEADILRTGEIDNVDS